VDFKIPGNDDALRSIRLFAGRIADAVQAGRGLRESAQADAAGGDKDKDKDGDQSDEGRRQARPARRAVAEAATAPAVV
jgi:small subunit ribosomal protein S2